MENLEQIKFAYGKAKNKRIWIFLIYNKVENRHFYILKTKTLADFSTRNILETNSTYSVETFQFLYEMIQLFTVNSELSNKKLNIELSKMNTIRVHTDLNNNRK